MRRTIRCVLVCLVLLAAASPSGLAQTAGNTPPATPLITQTINPSQLVTLAGNTRPEALNPANDRGQVPDTLPMEHMLLQLRRPADREQALEQLIDRLHDPASPDYHQWLSAAQLGAQFGPARSDVQTITAWLSANGSASTRSIPAAW